ncbi:MAG: DUF1460 domain-containing protein [Rikenellaceae bacterium]|jgi:hypothetical protein|nr:DUF1460 domain-containing protein [Rikenellaceae bacterium]
MKKIFFTLLLAGLSALAFGQTLPKVHYTPQDIELFDRYIEKFKGQKDLSMGELIARTGEYFVGTPYVNFTLEECEPEALIVNLRGLDCVTFVETTIALAQTVKSDSMTFSYYCDRLRELRYRGGNLIDFTSRLHYFSDWIWDKTISGRAVDITPLLGGDPYPIEVNMMTRVSKNYRQLVNNPEFIPVITRFEKAMSSHKMYSIPREKADSLQPWLENGYVIGSTTSGMMDITHCGFIYKENGKAHFMHASSNAKQVVITDSTLQDYLQSVKTMTGFMVVQIPDGTTVTAQSAEASSSSVSSLSDSLSLGTAETD